MKIETEFTEGELDRDFRGLWQDVESSQIERAVWLSEDVSTQLGWNPLDGGDPSASVEAPHMLVQFKSRPGKPLSYYLYRGVTEDEFEAMLAAESAGRFLNASIKGHYPFVRLSVEPGGHDDGGEGL